MGKIEIEGMEFFAYHGHYEEEQRIGNMFIVDIAIDADLSKPAYTDCIDDTIDYQTIYYLIKQEMAITSQLLEHLCHRIIETICANFKNINCIKVKLSKLNPPLGGKIQKVSVVFEKRFA